MSRSVHARPPRSALPPLATRWRWAFRVFALSVEIVRSGKVLFGDGRRRILARVHRREIDGDLDQLDLWDDDDWDYSEPWWHDRPTGLVFSESGRPLATIGDAARRAP